MSFDPRAIKTEDDLLDFVSKLVNAKTGIILGEKQRGMVQGRVSRRAREVGSADTKAYIEYVKTHLDLETEALISLLTTHHTFFFREFEHFEYLANSAIPRFVTAAKSGGSKTMRILSAACSRGQEVYSLAMFLKKHLPEGFDFEVVGGDVCAESVEFARRGVYKWDEVKTVPAHYLEGHWSRGTGAIADFVKVNENLKSKTKFISLNLIEPGFASMQDKFDVIFCRNVFIYFSREQIQQSTQYLLKKLNAEGDLIIGLSESLNGMDLPVVWEGPSVYRPKSTSAIPASPMITIIPSASEQSQVRSVPESIMQPKPATAAPLSVFAIDDSGTIRKLIERVCKEFGFQFQGAAVDGAEALKILTGPNAPQPNVITLDLHMPNMNGIEFLKEYRKRFSTPVVIVSSVNREEMSLAQEALKSGAQDYVEKPAMDRWKETAVELAAKIRAVKLMPGKITGGGIDIDKSFAIKKPEDSRRKWIVFTSTGASPTAVQFASKYIKRLSAVYCANADGTNYLKSKLTEVPVWNQTELILWKNQHPHDDLAVLIVGSFQPEYLQNLKKLNPNRILLEETSESAFAAEQLRREFAEKFDSYPLMSFSYEADRLVQKRKPA